MEECTSGHPECQQALPPLPTRVIDVGQTSTDIPKLCWGAYRSGPYCALSHCWGVDRKPLQTDDRTLLRRQIGIPLGTLPKTFQDAITITRSLSVQYLWIDSLCIIQDDTADWDRESAQMASIYENARLVIAASRASDSSRGCFSSRVLSKISSRPFFVDQKTEGWSVAFYLRPEKQRLHMYYHPESKYNVRRNYRLPLLTRGWALQERILATRAVHFTSEELVWECRKHTVCECMALNPITGRVQSEEMWKNAIQQSGHHRFELWHRITKLYMSLSITYQSDCLPALSGLAKQMQANGVGEYAAGLWRANIFGDLLWAPGMNGSRVRAKKWRAPSWSWASLNNGIELVMGNITSVEKLGPGYGASIGANPEASGSRIRIHLNLPSTEKQFSLKHIATPYATLENLHCPPSGQDATGQVAGTASITISAPVFSATVKFKIRDGYPDRHISKNGKQLRFECDCTGDSPSEGCSVLCMWVGNFLQKPAILVLVESRGISGLPPTAGAYERLGIFSLFYLGKDMETMIEWLVEAELRTIKIV
jgi:hypothetical protein